jgi:uncharacterized protein
MSAQATPATAVPSPCTSVCRIDERTSLCAGCWRTIAEIAAWGQMSDDEKREVWRQLDARRPQAGAAA